MLSTDTIILQVLEKAKNDGDELLEDFHISYPNEQIAEESNSIFVAGVSSENNMVGTDFETFTDLVEILIVTKQKEYDEAVFLIKTISSRICQILLKNKSKFPNKPVIRNINPEFNRDYVLTRGHIMVQVKTEPTNFEVSGEDLQVCKCILNKSDIEIK